MRVRVGLSVSGEYVGITGMCVGQTGVWPSAVAGFTVCVWGGGGVRRDLRARRDV